MSSIATARARTKDEEAQNDRQARSLGYEEQPATQDSSRTESLAGHGQPLDEAARVERLLTQLEARSMALVPYGYGTLREVPARRPNTALIAGVLVTLWLSTILLAMTYIRYNRMSQVADQARATTPILIPAEADSQQEQKVAKSVDHLTKVLVSSSERMNKLEAAMDRSNQDLRRIATKVNERVKPAAAASTAVETDTTLAAVSAGEALPKNWHKVLEIKPTEAAVAHRSSDGTVDYWLVPRGADKAGTKVLAIGTSPEGVVVHNLEDGKDYTLTPLGEWRNPTIVTPTN